MLSRKIRTLYYTLLSGPMYINGQVYKAFRQPTSPVKVQLGCGQVRYLNGWINLDANIVTARPDVWANLLHSLPFRSGSVAAFYSHHVIEHLPDDYQPKLFKELFRCLMQGGWVRIGVPDAENACRKFVEGDKSWFSGFPDERTSIGGRFANFLLCRGEHLTLLSYSYLNELMSCAGFVDITKQTPGKSGFKCNEVLALEEDSDKAVPHTLIVEARKP